MALCVTDLTAKGTDPLTSVKDYLRGEAHLIDSIPGVGLLSSCISDLASVKSERLGQQTIKLSWLR